MARLPKKPRKPKLPKQPKASSSIQVWENYFARVKDKMGDYDKKYKEWQKKVTAIKSEQSKKDSLKKKVRDLKLKYN